MPTLTVDSYIKSTPKAAHAKLKQLREIILSVAPEAEEKISYSMPMYKLGSPLVGFAAWKNHVALYPWNGSFTAQHQDLLKKYETSAGTIKFPLDKPLPVMLIKKIVRLRVTENATKAKTKSKKK